DAWSRIRGAFVQAFGSASNGEWNAIDVLPALTGGAALCLKALHVYFPRDIIPIYSRQHIRYFLRTLERPEAGDRSLGAVHLNRVLLESITKRTEFGAWSTPEIMRFLYLWADPRDERRIVKIAPGPDAKYW